MIPPFPAKFLGIGLLATAIGACDGENEARTTTSPDVACEGLRDCGAGPSPAAKENDLCWKKAGLEPGSYDLMHDLETNDGQSMICEGFILPSEASKIINVISNPQSLDFKQRRYFAKNLVKYPFYFTNSCLKTVKIESSEYFVDNWDEIFPKCALKQLSYTRDFKNWFVSRREEGIGFRNGEIWIVSVGNWNSDSRRNSDAWGGALMAISLGELGCAEISRTSHN